MQSPSMSLLPKRPPKPAVPPPPAVTTADLRDIPAWQVLRAAALAGQITILDLLDNLPWFQQAADWTAWRAFLCAVYGLPMSEAEYSIYVECTGRHDRPARKAKEVWVPVGRRGRKSAIAALIGVWEGCLARDYEPLLAKGERAKIPILAKNKAEAAAIRRFAMAILDSDALRGFKQGEPKGEQISLVTQVDLEIKAASLMAGRSHATPLALLDEIAFFKSEKSVAPDSEIISGIRPGMATIPDALLMALSSPYARRGELWKAFKDHFGRDGDPILVWRAPTTRMHDTPQIRSFVDEQYAKDPISAAAEYGAEFRKDLEIFIPLEVIQAVTVDHRTVLPYIETLKYQAFVDPSGGAHDSFTMCISHWDERVNKVIVDCIVSRDPGTTGFDPSKVAKEFCEILKGYGIKSVTGDRYAAGFTVSAFREGGIRYDPSEMDRSGIYSSFLPIATSGAVELLDDKRLQSQLVALDRRTSAGGRDTINHPPGGHDDIANAVAGAVVLVAKSRRKSVKVEAQPTTLEELRLQEFHKAVESRLRPIESASPPRYRSV